MMIWLFCCNLWNLCHEFLRRERFDVTRYMSREWIAEQKKK